MNLKHISSSEIIVKKLKGKWWEIQEDLVICCSLDVGVMYVTLKAGFTTDFGSIPKFAQGWIDRANDNLLAFLLHDAGYVYGGFSRATWDGLLYQALRLAGMGWFKAQAVHKAVALFGEYHFDNSNTIEHNLVKLEWRNK